MILRPEGSVSGLGTWAVEHRGTKLEVTIEPNSGGYTSSGAALLWLAWVDVRNRTSGRSISRSLCGPPIGYSFALISHERATYISLLSLANSGRQTPPLTWYRTPLTAAFNSFFPILAVHIPHHVTISSSAFSPCLGLLLLSLLFCTHAIRPWRMICYLEPFWLGGARG